MTDSVVGKILHDGRRARANEGAYVGGPVPFGLRLDAWGRWERSEAEVQLLIEMAHRRHDGATFAELCRWLNDDVQTLSPGGKRWASGIVHRILKNEIYYRTVEAIPANLTGHSYERALHNYSATGILADVVGGTNGRNGHG